MPLRAAAAEYLCGSTHAGRQGAGRAGSTGGHSAEPSLRAAALPSRRPATDPRNRCHRPPASGTCGAAAAMLPDRRLVPLLPAAGGNSGAGGAGQMGAGGRARLGSACGQGQGRVTERWVGEGRAWVNKVSVEKNNLFPVETLSNFT
ncbi:hypothetical protein C2845_PM09G04510 [Panicum miliaceum]|uniref:Uncharacterized protein n=1 Tax=Panicum miliaceum TaxID=4540 RepID=A0A3L6RX17_PANMI|nr:hypothetical protein C2845_PM09G04510 [Panicum miliaceum]